MYARVYSWSSLRLGDEDIRDKEREDHHVCIENIHPSSHLAMIHVDGLEIHSLVRYIYDITEECSRCSTNSIHMKMSNSMKSIGYPSSMNRNDKGI